MAPSGLVKHVALLTGLFAVALLCGTTNSFVLLSKSLDLAFAKRSASAHTLFSSLSLLGLYFVVPAGVLYDRYGVKAVACGGVVLHLGAMLLAAVAVPHSDTATSFSLLTFFGTLMGFGAGAAFLAVFSLSIQISPSGGGLSVAVVSAGLSLSALFLNVVSGITTKVHSDGKDTDDLWRVLLRVWLMIAVVFQGLGFLSTFLFKKGDYPHLAAGDRTGESTSLLHGEGDAEAPVAEGSIQRSTPSAVDGSADNGNDVITNDSVVESATMAESVADDSAGADMPAVSVVQSLQVLMHPYFWAIFVAYGIGIGCSVCVLISIGDVFSSYNTYVSIAPASKWMLIVFSLANATSNVVCSLGVERLVARRMISYRVFLAGFTFLMALDFLLLALFEGTEVQVGVLFILLLGATGAGFGCYLVIVPIMTGLLYGHRNFGKCFAFMQIASSAGSLLLPQIQTALIGKDRTYSHMHFFAAGMLALVGLILLVVPYRRMTFRI